MLAATTGGVTALHIVETDAKHRSKSPQEECPAEYSTSIDKMEPQLCAILSDCHVPWLLQHLLAEADMITTADLVQAYTPELFTNSIESDFSISTSYN